MMYSGLVEKNAFVKIRAKIKLKDKLQISRDKLKTTAIQKNQNLEEIQSTTELPEEERWLILGQISFNTQKRTMKSGIKEK